MWIVKDTPPSKKAAARPTELSEKAKRNTPSLAETKTNTGSEISQTSIERKKRKKFRRTNVQFSEADQEWATFSINTPPPLPAETEALAATRRNRNNNKKRKRAARADDRNGENEDADHVNIDESDSWGWSEVRYPESMMLSDDIGGFVCLEELDDVDVEFIGDERTGRTVKFKKVKNLKKKKDPRSAPAEPEKPLSVEETKKYYALDTFDEELAAQQVVNEDDRTVDGEAKSEVEKPAAKQDDTTAKPNIQMKQARQKIKEGKNFKKEIGAAATLAAKVDLQLEKKAEDKKGWLSIEDVDTAFDVSAWDSFNLALPIVRALQHAKFDQPTPIQQQALPLAMQGQDVVGAAETGSGKTLAFGIPIIQYLANRAAENSKEDNIKDGALTALILAPTRELAIQVKDHIVRISCFTRTKAMTIVGGMSVQKQHRLLENNPDIIVATPGRLWEVFSENEKYLKRLQNVKFLVLDEADRMLEAGHYRELNHILSVLSRHRQNTSDWPDAKEEESSSGQPLGNSSARKDRQTFVFTATLGKDLRFDLKKKKHKKVDPKLETGTMADLMERLDFTDASPAIVDMTTSGVVASTLVEAKVDCLKEEKDVFMYYFVTRYPGRTLVFVNSIDALRRLTPMFKLLGVEVLGLHAQMQQRQRLKNLDRFKQNDKAVMVASDVAARGLDIQLVEHVIHYQLPRSGEIYVHRSGRTARARRDGISLMLCGADEIPTYKRLCQALKKPQGYPDFPVDHGIVNEMKKHVALAKKIDEEEHHLNKATHDDDWMRKMAEAMDIEFDDDLLNSDRTERSDGDGQDDKADIRAKIRGWRNQLREMLAKPLMPHGASAKYLTGGTMRDLVERLMDETRNARMPASMTTRAVDEIKSRPGKRQKLQV